MLARDQAIGLVRKKRSHPFASHNACQDIRNLAAGNLEQRLPITGDEEIAALGTSLNTMAQNLNARMRELSDGKQRLELILEAMGQGVMVLDRAGRISLTNSSIGGVLGSDRDV